MDTYFANKVFITCPELCKEMAHLLCTLYKGSVVVVLAYVAESI